MDDSEPISRILTLAATDRSPAFQDQSGQAADNILAAAAKENRTFDGRSKNEQLEYFTYPKAPPSPSRASPRPGPTSSAAPPRSRAPGTHGLRPRTTRLGHSQHTDLINAMQLFARTTRAPRRCSTPRCMHSSRMPPQQGLRPSTSPTWATCSACSQRPRTASATAQAQQLDEQHKFNLTVLNTAGVLFSGATLPKNVVTGAKAEKFVTKGFKYSQTLFTWGRSVYSPTTDSFSTNNAADAAGRELQGRASDVEKSYSPAIAQGLIRSGKIDRRRPASRGTTPQTRTVSPDAWQNTDFTVWFTARSASTTGGVMTDLDTGYRMYEGSTMVSRSGARGRKVPGLVGGVPRAGTGCSGVAARPATVGLPTPSPGKVAAFDRCKLSERYDLNETVKAGGSLVTTGQGGQRVHAELGWR